MTIQIITTIKTPSGLIIRGYLRQGKPTRQTRSGQPGFQWSLEIAESEPSAATYCWEAETDVAAKAAQGFECGHWGGYLDEIVNYAKNHGLILSN